MAHPEQRKLCMSVRARFPHFFNGCSVLDVGSLDINGANRYLFDNCSYVGIDIAAGKNVDIISLCHEFNPPRFSYDTVISTECFEHDRHWRLSIKNIVENLVRPRGFFIFTCATNGREEHGTRRSKGYQSPFTSVRDEEWSDYYQNLNENDIREAIDLNSNFSSYGFEVDNMHHDLLFWGIKN